MLWKDVKSKLDANDKLIMVILFLVSMVFMILSDRYSYLFPFFIIFLFLWFIFFSWGFIKAGFPRKKEPRSAYLSYKDFVDLYKKPDKELKAIGAFAWGLTYLYQGEYDEAILYFKESLELDPEEVYVKWDHIGMSYHNKKEYENAIEFYQKSIELKFGYVDAWSHLAIAFINSKDYTKAIDICQKALELFPKNVALRKNLHAIYMHLKEYGKAISIWKNLLESEPENEVAWSHLSDAYAGKGEIKNAVTAGKNSIKFKSDYKVGWATLGDLYANTGKYRKAMESYDRALDIDPEYEYVKSFHRKLCNQLYSISKLNLGGVKGKRELQLIKRLKGMIQVSPRINITMLRKTLQLKPPSLFYDNIYNLTAELGLTVDGGYIKVDKMLVSEFFRELNLCFNLGINNEILLKELGSWYHNQVDKGILKLVTLAAKGKDNIKKGAIGYGGYGFVFRDKDFFEDISEEIFYYQAFVEVGEEHCEDRDRKEGKFKIDKLEYYTLINALMIGSLKTLLPSLKFLDARLSDVLFVVWVIVKTPKGKVFPAIYHFDKNRMALGDLSSGGMQIFSQKYPFICNYNLKDHSKEERYELAERFEKSLGKVPPTDYRTIYPGHDYRWHIEVNKGTRLFKQVNWEVNNFLNILRKKKTKWNFKWGDNR